MPPNASIARSPRRSSIRPPPLPLPLPVPHSPFRIKQDGKFYARLLAKDKAAPNPCRHSYSYYCAERGSVPFLWESRPGTSMPTDGGVSQMAAAGVIPAVTLPPSYLIRHCYGTLAPDPNSPPPKRRAKTKISGIFRRLTIRMQCLRAASVKVSSSSSRWLVSERAKHHDNHGAEQPVADECAAPRPSPWVLPFQFSGFCDRSIVRRWLGFNRSPPCGHDIKLDKCCFL